MKNGTIVFLNNYDNVQSDIERCMKDLQLISDFSVQEMTHNDFLVNIHGAIYVYVGKEEIHNVKREVVDRIDELKFLGQSFLGAKNKEHLFIGLYGRGKMYCDAFSCNIHSINQP